MLKPLRQVLSETSFCYNVCQCFYQMPKTQITTTTKNTEANDKWSLIMLQWFAGWFLRGGQAECCHCWYLHGQRDVWLYAVHCRRVYHSAGPGYFTHTHTCTRTSTCTLACMYIHTLTHICTYAHTHSYACAHLHTFTYLLTHICMCTSMHYVCTCTDTTVHTCTHM